MKVSDKQSSDSDKRTQSTKKLSPELNEFLHMLDALEDQLTKSSEESPDNQKH